MTAESGAKLFDPLEIARAIVLEPAPQLIAREVGIRALAEAYLELRGELPAACGHRYGGMRPGFELLCVRPAGHDGAHRATRLRGDLPTRSPGDDPSLDEVERTAAAAATCTVPYVAGERGFDRAWQEWAANAPRWAGEVLALIARIRQLDQLHTAAAKAVDALEADAELARQRMAELEARAGELIDAGDAVTAEMSGAMVELSPTQLVRAPLAIARQNAAVAGLRRIIGDRRPADRITVEFGSPAPTEPACPLPVVELPTLTKAQAQSSRIEYGGPHVFGCPRWSSPDGPCTCSSISAAAERPSCVPPSHLFDPGAPTCRCGARRVMACEACKGSGQAWAPHPCGYCEGSGYTDHEGFAIRLPPRGRPG